MLKTKSNFNPVTTHEISTNPLLSEWHFDNLKGFHVAHFHKRNNIQPTRKSFCKSFLICPKRQKGINVSFVPFSEMFKIDLPLVSLWHWLIQSDNREWCAECMCEPEEEKGKKKTCAQTTNSNLRWPVPFVINDLHAGISNRADGFGVCVSSSTGGRRMREREEEDEEEAGSHLLQHATMFQSSLRCLLCDRRAGSETECLSLSGECICTALLPVCLWQRSVFNLCTCGCKSIRVTVCLLTFISSFRSWYKGKTNHWHVVHRRHR